MQPTISNPKQNTTDKVKQVYEKYSKHLKQKLLSHEHLKSVSRNLVRSLTEMPSQELKNISRGRHADVFRQISIIMDPNNEEQVRMSWVRDVLHLNCKNQFEGFARCNFQKDLVKKQGKQPKNNCMKEVNEYISCIEGLSNKIIMSSLNMY